MRAVIIIAMFPFIMGCAYKGTVNYNHQRFKGENNSAETLMESSPNMDAQTDVSPTVPLSL